MGRAPCCEKMGLKRGPWTPEEDLILINYISLYGHGNWRALPKQAGLLRCGKSCRLRWMNYLRPDIKRGNFSREEEETIIKLHELLGNRWSAIAARLPGRTDNEIKNVWNTHLKKRLNQKKAVYVTQKEEAEPVNYPSEVRLDSPQHSASEISSVTTTSDTPAATFMDGDDAFGNFPEADEDFWSDVFSADNPAAMSDFPVAGSDQRVQFQVGNGYGSNSSLRDDSMEFWFNLFTAAGELPDLAEF